MSQNDTQNEQPQIPQIYLVTPKSMDLDIFPDQLRAVLLANDVACVRLSDLGDDADLMGRAADACRAVCHDLDVPIVVERHVILAETLGLDGVHLTDGARSARKIRTRLGEDAIIGCDCGQSRHDGLTAGEIGADYVSFGPVGAAPIGDGARATQDLFEWWSMMIEVPVVAEGALDHETLKTYAPFVDFFAIGSEIWTQDSPADSLSEMIKVIEKAAIDAKDRPINTALLLD